jgi:hypothetical protein
MRGVIRVRARAGCIAAVATLVTVMIPARGWSADAEAPPAIREFDLATLERLARQMYAQDGLAWKATDTLFAHRTEKDLQSDGVNGWITGKRDGRDVVRFIRIRDRDPEAIYDVVFSEAEPPSFSEPTPPTLTPEEIAQYKARRLALDNIERRCSDRYNTVAIKDPESDGWLVWALAASLDPNAILIGGHYRFTISADGKAIRSRDALSTTCLRFEKGSGSAGNLMSHVVSLTPVETHVFASLTYGKTFHVGTNDGRAWRIDAGRIVRIEQDAPDVDGFAARALAAIDEICTLIVSSKGATGSVKVIEATEHSDTFSVKDPPEGHVGMIACMRRHIVPSPNDYKVVMAGYKFSISDRGTGHPDRLGLLWRGEGKFQFEIYDGPQLSDELAARVRGRLDAFQQATQTKH